MHLFFFKSRISGPPGVLEAEVCDPPARGSISITTTLHRQFFRSRISGPPSVLEAEVCDPPARGSISIAQPLRRVVIRARRMLAELCTGSNPSVANTNFGITT